MTIAGVAFVKEESSKENDAFVKNLIKLSKLIDEGVLSSNGANKVFSEMKHRHEEMLKAIDTLGEMIADKEVL